MPMELFVSRINPQNRVYTMALRWALVDLKAVANARERLLRGESINHNGSTYKLYTPNKTN